MRIWLRLLSLALLLPVIGRLTAQESGTAATGIDNASVPSSVKDQATAVPDILLRTASGDLVPLRELLGADVIDELLERGERQLSQPATSVRRLELTAQIERDVATLKLELQILVRPDAEWVTVPLSFGDVYLTSFEHSSESGAGRSSLNSKPANQRDLSLFGSGLHTLRLELVTKARSVIAGTWQLNLQLPVAAASHATFSFAAPVELAQLPTGAVDKATRNESGVTAVEFWGLEGKTDLSWADVVPQVDQPPVIQVENRLKLDLTTIPVSLSGTQLLQISGSPVSELHVTFPQDCQLQEVDARNAAGVSVLSRFENVPNSSPPSAIIRLTTAVKGSLTVALDLELINRTYPQDIRVVLPSIAGANIQSGDLDLLFPTGLLVQQTTVQGAQRKRVATQTDQSTTATAFRMRSTASEIVLHVEETEAQFAVSPELTVQPEAQNVILTARFPVSVLQGSLLELPISWTGFSGGDWQLLPGNSRLTTDTGTRPLSLQVSDSEPDTLLLTFPERQSGDFTIEFKAFASLEAVRSGAVQLQCPEISSRRGQPFVLRTIESDEYSVRPISMGTGEVLPGVPVPAASPTDPSVAGRRMESWLQQDPSIPVRLELPQQAPAIRASVQVGLVPVEQGIQVTEQIQFLIEHRDLTSLTFTVPAGLQPVVKLPSATEPLRASLDSPTSWSFRLPEARRGEFTVEVRYLWSGQSATGTSLQNALQPAVSGPRMIHLPIVLPQGAEITSVEAGTSAISGVRVADSSGWVPVFSEQFDSAWLNTAETSDIPVEIVDQLHTVQLGPDLIAVRSRLVGSQILTSTVALFEAAPSAIVIETPSQIALDGIALNDEQLTATAARNAGRLKARTIAERDVIRWVIPVPEGLAASPVTVELRMRERVSAPVGLWNKLSMRRATIVGESPAVPVVWYFGTSGALQPATVSEPFSRLANGTALRLPWLSAPQATAERQLQAILSTCSSGADSKISETLENWLSDSDEPDLYFGSTTSPQLKVQLVSDTGLLLLAAAVCLLVFVLSVMLRGVSLLLTAILVGGLVVFAWALAPEWAPLLAAPVCLGGVFGLLSVSFQRLLTDRRWRLPRSGSSPDLPTVFGITGLLAPSVITRSEPLESRSVGSANSIPSGSAV